MDINRILFAGPFGYTSTRRIPRGHSSNGQQDPVSAAPAARCALLDGLQRTLKYGSFQLRVIFCDLVSVDDDDLRCTCVDDVFSVYGDVFGFSFRKTRSALSLGG